MDKGQRWNILLFIEALDIKLLILELNINKQDLLIPEKVDCYTP